MGYLGTTEIISFGASPVILPFPEAASQTFKAGAIVVLDTNGKVAIAAAPGATADTNSGIFLGVACADSTGITNALCNVECFNDHMGLYLPSYSATVFAQTMIGSATNYALYNDGSVWKVDLSNTTRPVARLITIDLTDRRPPVTQTSTNQSYQKMVVTGFAAGDRILVKIIPSVRHLA